MRTRIQLFFWATCRFDADAQVYVAGVPELRVFSQGTTIDEAFEAAKDALGLFLSSCYERNILDDTLREHGFDLAPPADGHPSSLPPSTEDLAHEVSIELLLNSGRRAGGSVCLS